MKEVDLTTLQLWQKNATPMILVDARGTASFTKGHLPGAISLPEGKVAHRHATVLPEKKARIVVYCSNPACHASIAAGQLLEERGYSDVWHYAGGLEEWQNAKLLIET